MSRRTRSLRRCPRRLRLESLEGRRLLTADLAALSDEFSEPSTLGDWQRIHQTEGWNADQLQVWDIDQTNPGQMTMIPHTVVWYQNWRGPLVFKEVTGDFVITSQVAIGDRDDVGGSDGDSIPNDAQFSLGGLMIRTPRDIEDPAVDWAPGSMADDGTNNGENYVFLSLGHAADGVGLSFEVKTTRNSDSQLELTPASAPTATLQIVRIGDAIITLIRQPGEDWQVHRRYTRSDLPDTLQVGMVSYTDWEKASDFDPFTHNGLTLQPGVADPTPAEPFNPDLVASFDYARFALPEVPPALAGVDLVNSAQEADLLAFLGDHPYQPEPPAGPEPPTIGDQAMSHQEDMLELALDEMLGETPIQWSAEVLGTELYQLDQDLGLGFTGDYYQNWAGANERWMTGADEWHYLLPSGELGRWGGSMEASTVVAQLDPSVYDDPSQLHAAAQVAAAAIDGPTLAIDPEAGFVGAFEVQVTGTAGEASWTEVIMVEVVNETAPTLQPIADQPLAPGQLSVDVAVTASDVDGDVVTLEAFVVDLPYSLDQEHGFWAEGEYYTNWGGEQEKWIRDAAGWWHYLLADGGLYRWGGSFGASTLVAELGSDVYNDPTLLTDAQPPAVQVQIVDGVLTVTRDATVTEPFQVLVKASDGDQTAVALFWILP